MIPFLIFLIGCTTAPKYKPGDCVGITAMRITDAGEWNSYGVMLGDFRIKEVRKGHLFSKYIEKSRRTDHFYIVEVWDRVNGAWYSDTYVFPVEDLDNLKYAFQWWDSTFTDFGCKSRE